MFRLLCATSAVALATAGSGNMNGAYQVWSGKPNAPFNDDYASKGHEYFDVWAPEIATHYGEVFWTDQGNNKIPQAIIDRFKGKVMAITGYEQDQVMVNPVGKPGVNPEDDISVPINWAYNHHYMAWMTGASSEMKHVKAAPGDTMAHGAATRWVAVDKPGVVRGPDDAPTSQMFSEGNGGESRKSFHGYPNGYAQLIESPEEWHITPMQIDTRNRDCGATPASINNCTRFTPGPEPKQARYGRGIPEGTNYSGILECPCNSGYGGSDQYYPSAKTHIVQHKVSVIGSGKCTAAQSIDDADTCFASVAALGLPAKTFTNQSVNDKTLPSGCSVITAANGDATVYYNVDTTLGCAASTKKVSTLTTAAGVTLEIAIVPDAKSSMSHSKKGVFCASNHNDILGSFPAKSASDADLAAALAACDAFCEKTDACHFCSVDQTAQPPHPAYRWTAIPACGDEKEWNGAIAGDISSKTTGGNATITLSGPADAWFGVGFDAVVMSDQPYTIVVNSSGVTEQTLGTCGSEADHCPGTYLANSLDVLSNTVVDNVRTVVVRRDVVGKSKAYYSFNYDTAGTINVITAVGVSQQFAYHKVHANGVISLANPVGTPTCICDVGQLGLLCEPNQTSCNSFTKNCIAGPAGDLLTQDNPTCNSRQYAGGLSCCHHGRIMLDTDQEVRPELLRYHMKFRFWFQEYVPAANASVQPSHYNLDRIYQQTEANAGEYDIPPAFAQPGNPVVGYEKWPLNTPTPGTTCTGTCPDGPDCECIHTIEYHWTVSNIRLIYAGGHCHAPACISIELYENSTGTPNLLCRQLPVYGTGDVANDKYDEAGYLALPPCLWGPESEGLQPSVFLGPNTPVFSIKKNYNTHVGHFGEMASWQMRGVSFPEPNTTRTVAVSEQ